MATKKFVITALNLEGKSLTFTIANPKTDIAIADVTAFKSAYNELFSDELTLKQAYYVDTTKSQIYPAA